MLLVVGTLFDRAFAGLCCVIRNDLFRVHVQVESPSRYDYYISFLLLVQLTIGQAYLTIFFTILFAFWAQYCFLPRRRPKKRLIETSSEI